MLYDPKWDQQTKAEPSLAGFIAWLETQQPDGRYDWACRGHCLCDQFFQATGADPGDWSLHKKVERATGVRLDGLAIQHPWTFGAALRRARAALKSSLPQEQRT
jgi:hypothetical protein